MLLFGKRLKNFELSSEQIKEDSSKLKKDWINPITYQYTNNLGEEYKTQRSVISINQPIFQSGGIYQAIKYADSTYKYASLDLEQQKLDSRERIADKQLQVAVTNKNKYDAPAKKKKKSFGKI
mgnify:CR=1 FL=1